MIQGFYHGDTPSGNARKITAGTDGVIIFLPVGQTTYFRKLPHKPGTQPVPCIFEVSDWLLERDAKVAALPEAVRGRDYN